jgi:site-specific recombinase XerD
MNSAIQPGLFPRDSGGLTPETSIQAAMDAFPLFMEEKEFSENTKRAFLSDLRLLGGRLGIGQPIGAIGTKDLNDFLNWLVYERGVPCSKKSYARRVTTLKVFFGWLYSSDVLPTDPATDLIQITVTSPLPTLPSEDEISAALEVTQSLMDGEEGGRSDSRPHLLLTLLLDTGIKKSEAMAIVPNHIDRDNPDSPLLFIRYKNPKYRNKERRIPLRPGWMNVLDLYLIQYEPADTLFTCTARNLEYILTSVGEEAGLNRGLLSFESIRWYSAFSDYQAGIDSKKLARRLGLSDSTWRTTKVKLRKLAEQQGQASGIQVSG